MRPSLTSSAAIFLALSCALACDKSDKPAGTSSGGGAAMGSPKATAEVKAGQKTFETQCVACHTIGKGDRTGPDLKGVTKRRTSEWLTKWMRDPVAMGATNHIGKEVSAKYGEVIMPDFELSDPQIAELLAFLKYASATGGYEPPKEAPRALAGADLEKAKSIYFDRCAGCHGDRRQGAAGPALTPERTRKLGSVVLRATVSHGSAGGMPAWGELGILSTKEVDLVAQYLQMPPTDAPSLPLEEIAKNHVLKVAVADRPKAPAHKRNWKNFFAVVMRDQGELAIIDGDSKEKQTAEISPLRVSGSPSRRIRGRGGP